MNHLELFTDGGSIKLGNEFYGSSAYLIRYGDRNFQYSSTVELGDNNIFELMAIYEGLKTITTQWDCLDDINLWIITDSSYCLQVLTECNTYRRDLSGVYYNKHNTVVGNMDLILKTVKLLNKIPHYKLFKIKSHVKLSNIHSSYEDFKRMNRIKLNITDYMIMMRCNDQCDQLVTRSFNKKKRQLAQKLGVQYVVS